MFLRVIFTILCTIIGTFLYLKIKSPKATKTYPNSVESTWAISTYHENNLPIIMKSIEALPSESIIKQLPYLVVISWKYDGSNNNGMPDTDVNSKMIIFEEAMASAMEGTNQAMLVYSKTGNNTKEFAYYCTKQNEFMKVLNQALQHHEAYPIEINFYEDVAWVDLKKRLNALNK